MKLTPRAQGYRFRHESWGPGMFIDVSRVGKGTDRSVTGTNERGERFTFIVSETDAGWERLGSTTKIRQGRA